MSAIGRVEPVGIRLERISASFRDRTRGMVMAVRDVDLEVRPGELMTLLGPSGCGKTTTLRMIAGFQEPSGGRIFIGDEDVTRAPANQRDIGFVFQNYALFPHLTIFGNVAYGLEVRRQTGREIRRAVEEVLDLVGLGGFGARLPNELSGGQQQRVALARAIVIRPRVLLFDEPLSNLDARLRVSMRTELRNLQQALRITAVYVTHDQDEAMAISDRIAVMENGRIAQLDTAEALYRGPSSAFVAGFLGDANLLAVTVTGVAGGRVTLDLGGQGLAAHSPASPPVGSAATVMVRPEAISMRRADGGLAAVVRARTYLGEKTEYEVELGGQALHVVQFDPAEAAGFAPGEAVSLGIPEDRVRLLEVDTQGGRS